MDIIEQPNRVDLLIHKAQQDAHRRKRRVRRIRLNPIESRIFWEDLIESGQEIGDPDDDLQYLAFVDRGDPDFNGTIIKLNIEGV